MVQPTVGKLVIDTVQQKNLCQREADDEEQGRATFNPLTGTSGREPVKAEGQKQKGAEVLEKSVRRIHRFIGHGKDGWPDEVGEGDSRSGDARNRHGNEGHLSQDEKGPDRRKHERRGQQREKAIAKESGREFPGFDQTAHELGSNEISPVAERSRWQRGWTGIQLES